MRTLWKAGGRTLGRRLQVAQHLAERLLVGIMLFGGTHAPPALLRQGEDGEAFGDVVFEPVGEAVGRATVGGDHLATATSCYKIEKCLTIPE